MNELTCDIRDAVVEKARQMGCTDAVARCIAAEAKEMQEMLERCGGNEAILRGVSSEGHKLMLAQRQFRKLEKKRKAEPVVPRAYRRKS